MIAVALLLASASPPAAEIEPEPAMEAFIALAEAELRKKLRRPGAVTFAWPYRLAAGPKGYYTCGRAHAGRGKPGGKGDPWVSAVVAGGQASNAQWSTRNGTLAWQCKKLVRNGTLIGR